MSSDQRLQGIFGNAYHPRQYESFEFVGTKPEEWKACKIKAMNQATGAITEFEIGGGYEEVKPITARLTPEQYAELLKDVEESEWAEGLCQLCGHIIKYPYPIIHRQKKLIMYVGIECVDNFPLASKEYKEGKKQFSASQIRQKFKLWASIAIQDIWILGRQEKKPKLLYPNYYALLKKIEAAMEDLDNQKTRSLKAIFRRARKLGISAPE